jgi:uncharacterized membrane protein
VEVALHALSTGINEPFTAVTCIDRLGQGLAKLAMRRIPVGASPGRRGQSARRFAGNTFVELLDSACNPIRAHAAESPEVGLRLLYMLIRLAGVARRPDDRAAIARQAGLLSPIDGKVAPGRGLP